jgi:uncharacterized protein YvpB
MQYDSMLSGSPLIPWEFFLVYLAAVSGVFIFFALQKIKRVWPALLLPLILLHGIILLILVSAALFILQPTPRVIKTTYQLSRNSTTPAIEITFDKPVMRKNLQKSITPEVPGLWLFTDPLYATHLYRKVVFYPYIPLSPATTYTIHLSGIRNFMNNLSSSHTFTFTTADVFDVLGDKTTVYAKDRIAVTGSLPTNGWDGIAVDTTVRIRFNQSVDINSAQEHFSIEPPVYGTFSWDKDTLIFTPSVYLAFATRYTFFISTGVTNSLGLQSTENYSASFTTQEETTKLAVPFFFQQHALSCEAATLRMVLAYRGIAVTEDELLQKIGFDPNGKRGTIWGNPHVGFVGNINGKQMVNGYGVYWEPIARAANYYRYAKSFEGWTTSQLIRSIQTSTPVIAWISINGYSPSLWLTPTGDHIKAVPDEHTVVVIGFLGPPNNPSYIIVNDPLIGEAYWSRESFEKKWNSLSNSGVLVF